jgi:hypothetical protein
MGAREHGIPFTSCSCSCLYSCSKRGTTAQRSVFLHHAYPIRGLSPAIFRTRGGGGIYLQPAADDELDIGYNAGYTLGMKTAISIPNEVFEAAEALAERLHVSRSELYARAVAAYLKQYSAEEVTQQLDAVYSEEESRLDRVAEAIQHFSLDKETW